jgi:hypothetical protein
MQPAAWLPSALLPTDHLHWTGIDERTARVTLTDGATTVSLDVVFGPAGEIAHASTVRYRDVQGVPVLTPWAGSYYRNAAYDGMMIPLAAQAAWTSSDGPLTAALAAHR